MGPADEQDVPCHSDILLEAGCIALMIMSLLQTSDSGADAAWPRLAPL